MKLKFLSANAIKIIAVLLMLLDHVCLYFFPHIVIIRHVCRGGLILFAYFIAEGCKYTKNKLKRFLMIFIFGIIFQVVYCGVVFNFKSLDSLNIFITFSFSILLIYCLQGIKKNIFVSNKKVVLYTFLFLLVLAISILASVFFDMEYEIFGILAPVLISIPDLSGTKFSDSVKANFDTQYKRIIFTIISILLLPLSVPTFGLYEWWSLLVIPILCCYNGQRGKLNLKHLFYVFYPLHFVVIYGVYMLVGGGVI